MPKQESQKDGNNRGNRRKTIELKVEYKRMNAFFADYTKNISHGGTFIQTDTPLSIGTEFVFQLGIPTLEEPLCIRGLVKWIITKEEIAHSKTKEKKAGMGIRFVYKKEQERIAVQRLVEGLMVDNLGRLVASKLIAKTKAHQGDKKDA